ncbi:MAG: VWA domain-containing protein [Campylobacterota bacterium]|nr:VWA domain-containing protein [Campylobacterota bacterium]
MSFVYPWVLFFLLPLIAYIYKNKIALRAKTNFKWTILLLLLIALARPTLSYKPTQEAQALSSVVMAMDISYSMRANDIAPNRFEATKQSIKAFLSINEHDRIALIGFTTNALMLSPLTQDHKLITIAMDSLNPKHIITKGTNLKKLIQKVAKFPKEVKVVVIFSDGGDEPLDSQTITLAQEHNIKVIAVAMATAKGSSIKVEDGLLKDNQGNIVISRLNPSFKTLAVATGGEFIPFSNPASVASEINEYIENLNEAKVIATQSIKSYYDLYYILVLIAMALLLHAYTSIYLKIIALLALLGINLNAGVVDNYYLSKANGYFESGEYNQSLQTLTKIDESSMQSRMIEANSYYRLGAYKRALSLYRSIKTTNPSIKHQLYHNLGNCEAKLKYYDKAKNYYIKALQLHDNNETRHNLEVVIHLKSKYNAKMGATNPQGGMSKSSGDKEESDEKKGDEESNEKSSGGGDSKSDKVKLDSKTTPSANTKPISSKAYELINKGYIYEKEPW